MRNGGMQLNLDFSQVPIHEGKKDSRISVACSEDFKNFFKLMIIARGSTESELGYEYILKGIQADLASVFMASPHLDKTLRDLLAKSR